MAVRSSALASLVPGLCFRCRTVIMADYWQKNFSFDAVSEKQNKVCTRKMQLDL